MMTLTDSTTIAEAPEPEFGGALLHELVATGQLSDDSAARALRANERMHGSIVDVLVRLGLCAERDVAAAVARICNIALVSEADFPQSPIHPELTNAQFLRDAKVVPIAQDDTRLVVAAADPCVDYVEQALRLAFRKPVEFVVATASDIEDAILRLYQTSTTEASEREPDASAPADNLNADFARLQEAASEAPVIRFVERVIARAVEARASDIHIEPFERNLRVRIRVDGVLRDEEPAPLSLAPAIVSRVKILARLDIAERRLPQDGSIKMNVRGHEVDLRVATSPVAHGEALVIRILDQAAVQLELGKLGFDTGVLERLTQILARPNGILLVTGPTGSGKSTTLYAALSRLNSAARKIITIEDPVEYKIDGLNQIQVKPDIGLDFARALRSVLRHDPDIIMVGEIRDGETARIAVQAALTGHLVLSTLHTNDAAAAVTRLLDMGVEDYLVASTVSGVVAQRLVRVLCPACREEIAAPVAIAGHPANRASGLSGPFYRAKGCSSCGGTGYRGRSIIAELLTFNDDFRKAILQHADAVRLRAIAIEAGMEPLYDNGMRRVAEGMTSHDEVLRVAQDVDL